MIRTVDIYKQMKNNVKRYYKGNIFNWHKKSQEHIEMIENWI